MLLTCCKGDKSEAVDYVRELFESEQEQLCEEGLIATHNLGS